MRRRRPDREDVFRAAVELVSTASVGFKSTARRYSLCPADAEDAYQRGLEILMTKAPTERCAELKPWLHTVIKHEALAIRRQRERMLTGTEPSLNRGPLESGALPEERVPELERAQRTGEALSELKPSEVQCLLLKAVGYSYDEISARTGFSRTKVNRCLTEGRKRFFASFAEIESGERCESFRSLLSAAGDGEASEPEERRLETHLRACPACRAALRAYRTLPSRLAELLPPVAFLPALEREGWWSRLHDTIAVWTADRGAALGHKLQQAGDAVSAQKATAVVASTAALTGGVVVQERASTQREPREQRQAGRSPETPAPSTGPDQAATLTPDAPASGGVPPGPGGAATTAGGTAAASGEFLPGPAEVVAAAQSASRSPVGQSPVPTRTAPRAVPDGVSPGIEPAAAGAGPAGQAGGGGTARGGSGPGGSGQEFGP